MSRTILIVIILPLVSLWGCAPKQDMAPGPYNDFEDDPSNMIVESEETEFQKIHVGYTKKIKTNEGE